MIKFELKSEWGGWGHVSIPDDMEVIVRTPDETHRMQMSLASLLELYGNVIHRQSCDIVIGTGDFIEIASEDDHVYFRTPLLYVRTTFNELKTGLELVIQEAFREKNDRSDTESRAEAIKNVQKRINEKGIEYDIERLYARLIED